MGTAAAARHIRSSTLTSSRILPGQSGYPAKARSIPDHVRVVTIADIFDALTSERPYSKRMTPFETMKIIIHDVDAGRLDRKICGEFAKVLTLNELMA